MSEVLLYTGAVLPVVWGIAHLFPTGSVVSGFGEISLDNRRIITMEWISEGITLIVLGSLVAAVTCTGSRGDVATVVYLICAAALIALAVVSLFTGFRVSFFPFKLCPFLFSTSAVLILAGSMAR